MVKLIPKVRRCRKCREVKALALFPANNAYPDGLNTRCSPCENAANRKNYHEGKQTRRTRRSMSVKGLTYQRYKNLCDLRGESVSGALEKLLNRVCEEAGIAEVVVLKPRVSNRRVVTAAEHDEAATQHFTF